MPHISGEEGEDRVAIVAQSLADVFGERAPALARVQADLAESDAMRALWIAVAERLDTATR